MRHVVLALLALGSCGWLVSPAGGITDVTFDADITAAAALVPILADELDFYFPGPCNRCHLTAADDAAAMTCCSTPEAGWDPLQKKVMLEPIV